MSKKPLTVFTIGPSDEMGGNIPCVYFLEKRKGKSKWGGPNIQIENNSTKALRVTVEDVTAEWKEKRRQDREAQERATLATLAKKYGSK